MSYAAPHNHRLSEHSFFFTPQERDHVRKAKHSTTPSITTKLLWPIWKCLSEWFIPESVAPNAIALLGVIFSIQAYQVTNKYYKDLPETTTLMVAGLILLSVACSSLDGVHAIRCRSGTPLGKIFSKVCSAIRHVFLCLTLFPILGIDHPKVQWYLIMAVQLVQLSNLFWSIDDWEERKLAKMIEDAKKDGKKPAKPIEAAASIYRVTKFFSTLFNTTEASLVEVALILARQYFTPTDQLETEILQPLRKMDVLISSYVFYGALSLCIFTLAIMRAPSGMKKLPIFACILVRALEPVSLIIPSLDNSHDSPESTDSLLGGAQLALIADGAMLGLLSIEVRVSATANRPIHTGVVAMCFTTVMSAVFALSTALMYTIGILTDLAYTTGTPLFVPVRNVYIDGVFDLCHIGHKRLMENALTHGNRLVVGVLSDEECISYKRRPVMTTEERCREVASCKWVSEVIPGAPNGVTREVIDEYNIHVVCLGAEYDKPDDKYYAVPRKMGITVTAPRTAGMSTSEIIKRIQNSSAEEMVAKDKLYGGSTVKE